MKEVEMYFIEFEWDGDKWYIPVSEFKNMVLHFQRSPQEMQPGLCMAVYKVILMRDGEIKYTWWAKEKEPALRLYNNLKEAQEKFKELT